MGDVAPIGSLTGKKQDHWTRYIYVCTYVIMHVLIVHYIHPVTSLYVGDILV